MTDYTVLRPVSVGKPLRQLKAGEHVRGMDLEGWGVEVAGLVAQGTLEPVAEPVKQPEPEPEVLTPAPPSADPHPVEQS
jgi:hypothetical protein